MIKKVRMNKMLRLLILTAAVVLMAASAWAQTSGSDTDAVVKEMVESFTKGGEEELRRYVRGNLDSVTTGM
ncbi:secreted protein, partial [Candidatus Magnetoovum chiemensis]